MCTEISYDKSIVRRNTERLKRFSHRYKQKHARVIFK